MHERKIHENAGKFPEIWALAIFSKFDYEYFKKKFSQFKQNLNSLDIFETSHTKFS